MKPTIILSVLLVGSFAAFAADKQKVVETVTSPDGTVTERKTTIKGEVVSLVPGRTIVIRPPEGPQVTYQLQSGFVLPTEIKIGQQVVLATEPLGSAMVVTHVTRETASDGTSTTTEERTITDPLGGTRKETTTTYKVKAYEPSKSVTLVGPDGNAVSFELNAESQVPSDIVVGKTVTVETSNVGPKQVIRRVVVINR